MTTFWKGMIVGALGSILLMSAGLYFSAQLNEKPPPAFVEGQIIRATWPGGESSNALMGAVLHAIYPKGTKSSTLVSSLRDSGFSVDARNDSAVARFGGPVCGETFYLNWKTDSEDRVSNINGSFSSSCL